MAGRLSDTVMDAVIDQLFGAVTYTPPGTHYIGLSTTTPANDGTGITEPTGNAYARVAVTNDTTSWPAAAARAKSNGVAITFPTPTGSWGTVGHFVIYDAATGGNFIGSGPLMTPQTIASGNAVSYAAGALVVSGPAS